MPTTSIAAQLKPHLHMITALKIRSFRGGRTVACQAFDWTRATADDREDLLGDTFGDGVPDDLMVSDEEGNRFLPFAVPFAYLGSSEEKGQLIQNEGLLICDTRDGSVHLIPIDGTAAYHQVTKIAGSIAALKLRPAKEGDFDAPVKPKPPPAKVKPLPKAGPVASSGSPDQLWWDGLDAFGKEWKFQLKCNAIPELRHAIKTVAEPERLTDQQLAKVLSSSTLELAVFKGGSLDLEPLRRFPKVRELAFRGFAALTNTRPLAEMVELRTLTLRDCHLAEVGFLKGLRRLETLDLRSNGLKDLAPLKGLSGLTDLDVGYNRLEDIAPLATLTHLKNLYLRINRIKNLAPLSSLTGLQELYVGNNLFSDVSPLAKLSHLVKLDIEGPFAKGKVKDLAPLGSLKELQWLDVSSNQFTDLSALKSCADLKILVCEAMHGPVGGFQELLGLKKLERINTHPDIMRKPDRDAFKKLRPKVKIAF
jgi:internalin A